MKLLYTLIILFAFSFAEDELHLLNGTIYHGKYFGISGSEVFFKVDESYSLQPVEISKIDYLIADNIKISNLDFVILNKNNTKLKDEISEAGLLLDSFRDGFYGGILMNLIGSSIATYGSYQDESFYIYTGLGIAFIGWLTTFLSFSDIGNAGEILNNVSEPNVK